LLQAGRRLAERDPLDKAIRLVLRPKDWMFDLTDALDLTLDAALEDAYARAAAAAADLYAELAMSPRNGPSGRGVRSRRPMMRNSNRLPVTGESHHA
jgi:hypothetical protein